LVTAFLTGAAAAAGVANIIFYLKEARRPQFAGRLFSTLILLLIVGALFYSFRCPHSPGHDDDDRPSLARELIERGVLLFPRFTDCV
jgi:uncharacterized membrane protein HdeD (DUF308 family)